MSFAVSINAHVAGPIPALVAHQGGWDEILLVAGPMAMIAGLLWLARRRVTRHTRPDEAPTSPEL